VAAPPADPAAGAPRPASGSTAPAPGPATPALAVLLAEHDPDVAELARRYLTRAGAHVTITTGADETTAALAARTASVAVLDLTMPGLDARRLRRLLTHSSRAAAPPPARKTSPPPSRGSSPPPSRSTPPPPSRSTPPPSRRISPPAPHSTHQPQSPLPPHQPQNPLPSHQPSNPPPSRLPTLFLLSASMRPRDLRIAAESCLWRPFSPRLLVSRVLAIAPRPSLPPSPARAATATEVPEPTTALTPAESALLTALAGHPGRVLSRGRLQAILSRSTPGHPASGRAIDVHVSQLRAKLPDPSVIRTVRGVGYILDAPASPGQTTPGTHAG
jgi:DNA-binding response OmpR family regulator